MWWTIITGAMASATALLIAFGAYRWQKQQDRRLQVQLEKRKAYDEFLSAASDYFTALIMARNARHGGAEVLRSANTFHFSMEKHKTSLACYGTPEVLEQCYRYADCLDIYRSHLNKELNDRRPSRLAAGVESLSEAHAFLHDARMRAIVLARSDALGISAEQARSDLQRGSSGPTSRRAGHNGKPAGGGAAALPFAIGGNWQESARDAGKASQEVLLPG